MKLSQNAAAEPVPGLHEFREDAPTTIVGQEIGLEMMSARMSMLGGGLANRLPHLVLSGPPSCGKSSALNLVAKAYDTPVLTLYASDLLHSMQTSSAGFGGGLISAIQEAMENEIDAFDSPEFLAIRIEGAEHLLAKNGGERGIIMQGLIAALMKRPSVIVRNASGEALKFSADDLLFVLETDLHNGISPNKMGFNEISASSSLSQPQTAFLPYLEPPLAMQLVEANFFELTREKMTRVCLNSGGPVERFKRALLSIGLELILEHRAVSSLCDLAITSGAGVRGLTDHLCRIVMAQTTEFEVNNLGSGSQQIWEIRFTDLSQPPKITAKPGERPRTMRKRQTRYKPGPNAIPRPRRASAYGNRLATVEEISSMFDFKTTHE